MSGMLIGGVMFGQYSLGGAVPDDVPPFGHYQDLLASATESQSFTASATSQSLTASASTSQSLLASVETINEGNY